MDSSIHTHTVLLLQHKYIIRNDATLKYHALPYQSSLARCMPWMPHGISPTSACQNTQSGQGDALAQARCKSPRVSIIL